MGSWVEIYGSYLAPDSRSWAGTDFNGTSAPTSLDGTSVTIGGQPADAPPLGTIRSLAYFLPVIEEVLNLHVGPEPSGKRTRASK